MDQIACLVLCAVHGFVGCATVYNPRESMAILFESTGMQLKSGLVFNNELSMFLLMAAGAFQAFIGLLFFVIAFSLKAGHRKCFLALYMISVNPLLIYSLTKSSPFGYKFEKPEDFLLAPIPALAGMGLVAFSGIMLGKRSSSAGGKAKQK